MFYTSQLRFGRIILTLHLWQLYTNEFKSLGYKQKKTCFLLTWQQPMNGSDSSRNSGPVFQQGSGPVRVSNVHALKLHHEAVTRDESYPLKAETKKSHDPK